MREIGVPDHSPESERRARNIFRRFLCECGFTMLQRSIWFSDKDVAGPLLEFVEYNKLTPWVHVIVGNILSEGKMKLSLFGRSSKK